MLNASAFYGNFDHPNCVQVLFEAQLEAHRPLMFSLFLLRQNLPQDKGGILNERY